MFGSWDVKSEEEHELHRPEYSTHPARPRVIPCSQPWACCTCVQQWDSLLSLLSFSFGLPSSRVLVQQVCPSSKQLGQLALVVRVLGQRLLLELCEERFSAT